MALDAAISVADGPGDVVISAMPTGLPATYPNRIPSVIGEVISYPVTVVGTQLHDVDEVALVASIKGLVLAEARAKLDDYGDVEVTLWPDWVSTIPTRTDRISLTLGEPQPSASPAP